MIEWWQILLITIYAFYQILDELTIVSSAGSPVFAGLVTGLIMGDMTTGLLIGGSMQLTVLGVGTFGGASRIDANSGTVIATAFSIAVGMDPQLALTSLAVPIAALMVYTDILARMSNVFFAHRIDKNINDHAYSAININYLCGAIAWGLSRALPIFLALVFGGPLVEALVSAMQSGILKIIADGLTLAGGVLPALGFAILLRYLPTKRHIAYLILSFALTAILITLFGNVAAIGNALDGLLPSSLGRSYNSLPMLAMAAIGFAFAVMVYQRSVNDNDSSTSAKKSTSATGEIEDDEL
ncbi:PTS sugar transporter subunit IIC [Testudinibacter sp. TR-2022]|uniref:PTS mannose/fructose/sorbose/N-acetylgalactosamine transporter subunit IIC n=1 Tax=Testudinibacter sp. TR-2022 TaxID=2585029 RepID=UPI0011192AD2|nr:PTS sugar transporter subunit IIC [Testudinibacter sp. TR-2022]TNH04097.1 PTS sugar transporter subunit IIC [Pasteurellaceae bacterium Phil31]TNH09055.1 PTS sugar transporter subunit IIC [Testudinibacter sp. TR-2022]TNH12892.1 PTS sugar transporter subunit IIC [Testudinibacter sp. TR-2022]TNH13108.1 PTS sugar transporter subunit IIC [Testudinibacter sp. TR-2022]TNH18209.1 PTS sugar transporter subunit IIC [Testudinibacter sp. TR-2022]